MIELSEFGVAGLQPAGDKEFVRIGRKHVFRSG